MNVVNLHASIHTRNCILLTLSYFSACMYLVCFLAFLTIHECHRVLHFGQKVNRRIWDPVCEATWGEYAIRDDVRKLKQVGAIKEVFYPEWLANTVVVKKKSGKWRVCVDFIDLNKECPKHLFPMPRID